MEINNQRMMVLITILAGFRQKGLREFGKAAEISADAKEVLNNLGSACAENELYDEAIMYFSRALRIDPEYQMARDNFISSSANNAAIA